MQILDGESEGEDGFMNYLSTHPETKERINALKSDNQININFKENQSLKTIFSKIQQSINKP
jgi:predicted Zn-dependent protease